MLNRVMLFSSGQPSRRATRRLVRMKKSRPDSRGLRHEPNRLSAPGQRSRCPLADVTAVYAARANSSLALIGF